MLIKAFRVLENYKKVLVKLTGIARYRHWHTTQPQVHQQTHHATVEVVVALQSNVKTGFNFQRFFQSAFKKDFLHSFKHQIHILKSFARFLPLRRQIWPLYSLCFGISLLEKQQTDPVECSDFSQSSAFSKYYVSTEWNSLKKLKFGIENLISEEKDKPDFVKLSDLTVVKFLAKGCEGAVYEVKSANTECTDKLVLKRWFNYFDYESINISEYDLQQRFNTQCSFLQHVDRLGHPNIIPILGHFSDSVVSLPKDVEEYPEALPDWLYPDGCGKDSTFYMVMPQCDFTLKEYLSNHILSTDQAMSLFTQLLETDIFLKERKVAHRDIKPDNILIKVLENGSLQLFLSDFGCSLHEKLIIPFHEDVNVDYGGSVMFYVPEIKNTKPGYFANLDFTKSDLWLIGTLAYLLFNQWDDYYNLFLSNAKLAPPINTASTPFQNLLKLILSENPKQRPLSTEAADIVHLLSMQPPRQVLQSPTLLKDWYFTQAASDFITKNNFRQFFYQRSTSLSLHTAAQFLLDNGY